MPEFGTDSVGLLDRYHYDLRPLGGESSEEVRQRVITFLEDVGARNDWAPVTVTHGGVIRWIGFLLSGRRGTSVPNLSVCAFNLSAHGPDRKAPMTGTTLTALPPPALALLASPATAVLVTLDKQGAPETTPVWFTMIDNSIVVSTLEARKKHRNASSDSRVSFLVVDPANDQRYVEVRGTTTVRPDPSGGVRDLIAPSMGWSTGRSGTR